jgi:hypothetical protein
LNSMEALNEHVVVGHESRDEIDSSY